MRATCNKCGYPEKTCLCNHITPIQLPINVTVIQHPKEADHAKNTARLLALCSSNITIVRSDCSTEMRYIQSTCNTNECAILYPTPTSNVFEAHKTTLAETLTSLVVIDGSWKQAYAIMQQHSWLQSLPCYHFNAAPKTRYRIRHTRFSDGLSTLEATAYALSTLYNINANGLYKLQDAMQNNWQGPITHQRNIDLH